MFVKERVGDGVDVKVGVGVPVGTIVVDDVGDFVRGDVILEDNVHDLEFVFEMLSVSVDVETAVGVNVYVAVFVKVR